MSSVLQNPFSWHSSAIGIDAPVSSLTLTSPNNEKLNITGLKNQHLIEIFIPQRRTVSKVMISVIARTHVRARTHARARAYARTHARTHAHAHTCTTHMHTCTHTHTHTQHTHTHTHTHTQTGTCTHTDD